MADKQEQIELLKQILQELKLLNDSAGRSSVQLANLAASLGDDEAVEPLRKSEYLIIAAAQADDTSKFKQIPGEDPNTRLLMQIRQDVAFEWLQIVDRTYEGFWITAVGAGLNATFKTPPFADKDMQIYKDFSECQVSALSKYQEWYSTDGGAQ